MNTESQSVAASGRLPYGRAVSLIAPSILAADFSRLAEEIRSVEEAGADWLHVDVMDGHFVPNITIGPDVVKALRKSSKLPLDVHLMIEHPERYVGAFADAGAAYISVHQEACPHLHAVIQQIRKAGARPVVAVNPATPLCMVKPVLADIDMLLIMSVNPGFGGQKFIPSALDCLRQARGIKQERGLEFLIEIDGGIKRENAGEVAAAGAEVFVSGTGIFREEDRKQAVTAIRREIEAAGGG